VGGLAVLKQEEEPVCKVDFLSVSSFDDGMSMLEQIYRLIGYTRGLTPTSGMKIIG
jgi:hypothetical protein